MSTNGSNLVLYPKQGGGLGKPSGVRGLGKTLVGGWGHLESQGQDKGLGGGWRISILLPPWEGLLRCKGNREGQAGTDGGQDREETYQQL